MEFKCQKCKQVFNSEDEAKLHSKNNAGHNKFDFKAIGVIKNIEE